MTLQRIRLELARTPQFPNGSSRHGYEFTAPLDARGQLDPAGWSRDKAACTVRRFWEKADDEAGTLIHRRDGKWAFTYNASVLGAGQRGQKGHRRFVHSYRQTRRTEQKRQ